jgi:MFS family permease
VLNAYLLALAALYPLLPRLRGPIPPIAGAVAMAAGAIVCARADSTAVLVAGQAIQGAGAAAVLARVGIPRSSLAALALPAAALALGPLVGGVFAEQNWWRVFFWGGVPLSAVMAVAALAAARAEQDEPARQDPVKLLAFAAGLVALTVALVQAEPWGWGWAALAGVFGALGISGVARGLSAPAFARAALAGCLAALVFLVPEYFQLVRNLSGLRSGILLLAVTLSVVTVWALSGWLGRLVSVRALWLGGIACAAVGLGLLVPIDTHTRYAILIGALGLAGTGLGLAAGATSRLPQAEPPNVAATLAGATLGLAAAGAAFQLTQADERDSGATFGDALAAGVGWAAVLMLAMLVAAVVSRPASSEARPAAGS